jgi:hypothetical protein
MLYKYGDKFVVEPLLLIEVVGSMAKSQPVAINYGDQDIYNVTINGNSLYVPECILQILVTKNMGASLGSQK